MDNAGQGKRKTRTYLAACALVISVFVPLALLCAPQQAAAQSSGFSPGVSNALSAAKAAAEYKQAKPKGEKDPNQAILGSSDSGTPGPLSGSMPQTGSVPPTGSTKPAISKPSVPGQSFNPLQICELVFGLINQIRQQQNQQGQQSGAGGKPSSGAGQPSTGTVSPPAGGGSALCPS